MAKSKYEYVKKFEQDDALLPGCWIVVRIDGKGFTKFSAAHGFVKPNDSRALNLMDNCAKEVLQVFGDVRIAYGESDEYSFVFPKDSTLYGRRASKLTSLVVSLFSASYVRSWSTYFPDTQLLSTPCFDGRAVLYPTDDCLRDYLSWRQVDTHINNQYNTCFWALVHSGKTHIEAQNVLKGTQTNFKNELLYTEFGINYSQLPPQFRKGSVVIRQQESVSVTRAESQLKVTREVMRPTVLHVDIIGKDFWEKHPSLLK